MTTAVILQARMGSTRLPGKVLADLAGKPMLERIVERVRPAREVDELVVATSDVHADDPVAELAARLGVTVFRGSEEDVLDRYYSAAAQVQAGTIVRLTSDNPFVNAEVVDWTVGAFWDAGVDYADTWASETIAHGLAVEVISFAALETAWREDGDASSREHVAPFIYGHPDRFRILHLDREGWGAGLELSVDTAADLTRVRALYDRLPDGFSIAEAVEAAR